MANDTVQALNALLTIVNYLQSMGNGMLTLCVSFDSILQSVAITTEK